MNVDVVQLKFQRFGNEETNYHILNKNYCCEELKTLMDKEQIIPVRYETTIGFSKDVNAHKKTLLKLALNFGNSEDIYIINSCPFCKDDISVRIKETQDVSKKVYDLQQKIKYLLNKEKIASSSEQKAISAEVAQINSQLSEYYYITTKEKGEENVKNLA